MTAPSNPLLRSQIKFTPSPYKKKNQRVEVHTKSFSSHHETPFLYLVAIQDYRNLIKTMEIRS